MRGAAVLALLTTLLPAVARGQAAPPAPLAADARETARTLSAQAVKLYDAGSFALALELFEKADALYPTPQYRVYAARAYAKLGKLSRAVDRYEEARRMPLPPGAPPSFAEAQATAEDERTEIARRLALLRVDVAGAPPAEVTLTVDGEPVSAAARMRLVLDPGRHQIAAKAPRARESTRTVDLQEGTSSSVLVTLQPLEPARPFRPLAITAGVVGGAGVVVAVVTGVVLAEKRSAILGACPHQLCTPAGRALVDSVAPIDHVNLGGWIAAGVGAAGAAVFLVLDLRGSSAATAIVPAPLPGGGGAWITRRF